MKPIILLLLFPLLTFGSSYKSSYPYHISTGLTDTDTIVIGDINNDKIIDTAFITGPKWISDEEGWGDPTVSPYEIDITFSCGVPPIHNGTAVMGYIENIGDIDGDGYSEVIVVPIWFIGCWGRMEFYTLKDGQWRHFGDADCHICNEDGYRYIERITRLGRNKIRVIEDAWDEDIADRVKKPKTIRVSDWRKNNQ